MCDLAVSPSIHLELKVHLVSVEMFEVQRFHLLFVQWLFVVMVKDTSFYHLLLSVLSVTASDIHQKYACWVEM